MSQAIPVNQRSGRSRSGRGGTKRNLAVLEQRRMHAAELFEEGVTPAEIARRVGVRHQIVSQWRKAWRQGGRDALRSGGPVGRKPKLTVEQLQTVNAALVAGAVAFGYSSDVWTLPRVAEVIQRVTGVSYHPHYVWYLLRQQLQWTWQRPARRAIERDEQAIHDWVKQRWPQLKKTARRQNALIVFEDESGVSLLPSVRATWAPRGQTPVLRHRFNYRRLSVAGALVYEPNGSDAHLVFQLRPGAYTTESLIQFLEALHQHEEHRSVRLIWDGLPAHRSRCMTDWLSRQRDWLLVERLPSYAPELNPTEQVWGNLKSQELANLCADTLDTAADYALDGLQRINDDASLCFAFLRHAGLPL